MKNEIFFEIKRKIVHLLGLIPIFGYVFLLNNYTKDLALLFLFAGLFICLILDYFRVEYNKINFIHIREKECSGFHASTFFFIGLILTFLFFEHNIALTSALIVIFGDFSSALVGKLFGKKKIFRNKSYLGSLAGLLACLIVGFFTLNSILIIVSMALAYSFIDLATHKLDDNLTIPIFTSIIGSLFSLI